jgi:hypothetical protein
MKCDPKLNSKKLKVTLRCEFLPAIKTWILGFWVVTPCGLIDRHQSFEEAHVLYLQPEDGGSMFIRNVSICPQIHTQNIQIINIKVVVSKPHCMYTYTMHFNGALKL